MTTEEINAALINHRIATLEEQVATQGKQISQLTRYSWIVLGFIAALQTLPLINQVLEVLTQ